MKHPVALLLGFGLATVTLVAGVSPGGRKREFGPKGSGLSLWCASNKSCCQCRVYDDQTGEALTGLEATQLERFIAMPEGRCTYGGGDGAACP